MDEFDSSSQVRTRAKRSRTGCIQCRSRKVKCDEHRPTCHQCMKAGKSCTITDSIFKPHTLSSETLHEPEVETIITRGLSSSTRTAPKVAQARQPHPTSSQLVANYVASSDLASPPQVVQHQDADEEQFDHDLEMHTSTVASGSRIYERGFGTSEAATTPSPSLTRYVALSETSIDSYEENFFVRYFSEHIAPWLDLVNFQRYFGHECISLLRDHSLLRFATCALAAKQLSQSSVSVRTASSGTSKAQATAVQTLLKRDRNFLWYGAKYYDKAITTLARQIAPQASQIYTSPSETGSHAPFYHMLTRAEGEDPIVRLLATCLLIQFESLSGNSRGWTGHLNGFSKLLTVLESSIAPDVSPSQEKFLDARSQRALRAAFWWFAINDMEESFVNHRRMRIDLDNMSLWQRMGLHMHQGGEVMDLDTCETPDAPPHLQEDLWSFILIRIVCRLVNALASGNVAGESTENVSTNVINTGDLHTIQLDLDSWMSSTAALFQPDCTWHFQTASDSNDLSDAEMWYSHSFRAVTAMYYHMAYMLLLIHQPQLLLQTVDGRQPYDLLKSMQMLQSRLRSHACQVLAITNGMSADSAVRVRAVQPLYIVGRSLSARNDRKCIVENIRSIENDLGLMCEYRVVDLIEEWSVSYESLGLSPARAESSSS